MRGESEGWRRRGAGEPVSGGVMGGADERAENRGRAGGLEISVDVGFDSSGQEPLETIWW